ncbi:MAG: 4Fe-4S dicluster domain-containing protein [Candidatus Omnitrophota bacterium]|nr:4Fe-4S dicluster domain-containing protein [Candidatus Omnitrophota bacterium]
MNKKTTQIKIDKEKCKGCLLCLKVCPKQNVLERSKDLNKRGAQFIVIKHADECTGCALCAIMCPDCAIEIEENK